MIYFICGQACAGKSHYIKTHFKKENTILIDLYDFQKKYNFLSFKEISQSYEDCKNQLINAIQDKERNGKDIVLEHTLLKAIRRKFYIDEIRKITDEQIIIYFLKPNNEILLKRNQLRGFKKGEALFNIENSNSVMETPTLSEGFSEVHIMTE